MEAYKNLDKLQEVIGYKFNDEKLLCHAMTHSSYVGDHYLDKSSSNERLEFLGDAVLELSSSDFLFKNYVNMHEGELTKLRASAVCEFALAACARSIDLGEYIVLGRGEKNTRGMERNSILSDAFEALIGAIYLDGGFANAKDFVLRFVMNDLENKQLFYDSKSILQEIVQKDHIGDLTYEVLSESGPEHCKEFVAAVFIGGKQYSTGKGTSKKAAEQAAAYETLLLMKNEENSQK